MLIRTEHSYGKIWILRSSFISWILLESCCIQTATGKVTCTQTKNAGYIFSFRLRSRKQKFWKGCSSYFGWTNECEFPVRSWCYSGWCNPWASKQRDLVGLGREWCHFLIWDCWGICWILCPVLMLRHPERMQKTGKAVQKQLKEWFLALESLPCNERLQKLLHGFSSLSKRRVRSNLTAMYKHQYCEKISDASLPSGKETAAEMKTYRWGTRKDRLPYTSCTAGAVCPLSASVCLPLLPWETGSPNKSSHHYCSLL